MTTFDRDDIPANPSTAESLDHIAARAMARRSFLKGGLGASAALFLGAGSAFAQNRAATAGQAAGATVATSNGTLGFTQIPMSTADTITVPQGYSWAVINRWGDPLFSDSPRFAGDAGDGGEAQARQIGYNHDGMHFFPIDTADGIDGSSVEGLLVTNHEYVTPEYFYPKGVQPGGDNWNLDWIRKSQHAQGASVVHIKLADGKWRAVLDSPFNRSINATTPMQLVGAAAGHPLARTHADPSGRHVLGTFGNCGNGYTLWNTYLTCEENFTDYFGIGDRQEDQADYPDDEYRAGLQRYKGGTKSAAGDYRWDTHDTRFDWTEEPNEFNRHGWIVEIDPFDPHSAPKKLTALGRFKHENAALTLAADGRVVVYMGDDQRSEYLYKFVSDGKYEAGNDRMNRLLLHTGTLYVARFDAEAATDAGAGKGEWVPLRLDTPTPGGKRLGDLFGDDMGRLLIHTRQAADVVGATPMDRPEWVAVHPATGEAYVTLTNNSHRGSGKPRWPDGLDHPGPDAPNPRAENQYGHIVRWRDSLGDAAARTFEWDIFVLAGNPVIHAGEDPRSGTPNVTTENTFNSPDGLAFDRQGRLWVQTDGNHSNQGAYEGQGNNQMLVADPQSGELRRFLTGPKGCEVTGITWTPDQRYLFVNIQHPGEGPSVAEAQAQPLAVSTWPDGEQASRPRPATVVIWKDDMGIVGS